MRTKLDLRKKLKTRLASISDLEHHQLSLKVSTNLNQLLMDLLVIQKKLITGVFAPIEKEPTWNLLIDEGLNNLTAYPAYVHQMVFKLSQLSDLKISRDFGVDILGPNENCPIVTPEIIIVPGLGFTADGKRLGRGKGFYDRYLEKQNVVKIGIAFESQIEKELPTDPHDVLMDFVVTDQNIYKTKISKG